MTTDEPQSQAHQETSGSDRRLPGYDATKPSEIPVAGWWWVLKRVGKQINDHRLSMVSAALAFYGMLGVFPALTALVATYGLLFDPHDIWEQSQKLAVVLPAEAHNVLFDQLRSLVDADGFELGFGLLVSMSLLLWSASSGVENLIRGVNLAYGETEGRSFLELRLLAVCFTIGGITFAAIAIALIAIVPQLLLLVGYEKTGQQLVSALRWPFLTLGIIMILAVLYRFGPDRNDARWRWTSWGAVAAASIWLTGSAGFAWYVERFGSYNETYGTLGAVVVFLLWLYLSAFAILLGAELNAAMELQTARDSTVGPEEPIGERGAVVADSEPPQRPMDDEDE